MFLRNPLGDALASGRSFSPCGAGCGGCWLEDCWAAGALSFGISAAVPAGFSAALPGTWPHAPEVRLKNNTSAAMLKGRGKTIGFNFLRLR
jgi:hypothetical protein